MAAFDANLTQSDFNVLEVKWLIRIIELRVSRYELVVTFWSQVQVDILEVQPSDSAQVFKQSRVSLLWLSNACNNLGVLFELEAHSY